MGRASRSFRLLRHGAAPGPRNMGVDEALLARAERDGEGSVRLYGWEGPWLSLGHAQALSDERGRACREAGVGVVRRSTGGRAVLHGGDLTYAIAAPRDWLPAGLRPSYELVCAALVAALRELGVPAEATAEAPPGPGGDFDCFATPARSEICIGSRKLCGSAQRRTGRAFLQHGSLRLRADPPVALAAAGLASASGASRSAGGGATSLAEEGFALEREQIESVFLDQLAAALDTRWRPDALTAPEDEAASRRGFGPAR